MKLKKLLTLAAVVCFYSTSNVGAQSAINDIPEEIDVNDATITEIGHATMNMKREIVTDPRTNLTDTIYKVESIEWNTEAGTAKKRMARRSPVSGSDFYDKDSSSYFDFWWFNYNYPSINADGEPVLLSSQACMPDDDCDYVNNVLIGCHVTITSNKECPTNYSQSGSLKSDVNFLQNFAGSGRWGSVETEPALYNLVILPDYEGYGITRDHAHPYLYQELTARQVVDAVRYGIQLYKTSEAVSEVRHPFRDTWRTICLGYSQGGSVSLATQRFIEQNGLTDELRLAGSICGDGPYDLLSTLMYYVGNDLDGKQMTMPVVLPLILKGMCDYNPYMKSHQVSDYLSERFLETGVIDWIAAKEKTTTDITNAWEKLYEEGKDGDESYFRGVLTEDGAAYLKNILKAEGYNYFKTLYNNNSGNYTSADGIPLPAHRGVMEDLHFALESNNMTMGWQPQHPIFLYHSYNDTVVPEKNRERAGNTLSDWVIKIKGAGKDHVDEATSFFFLEDNKVDYCIRLLSGFNIHPTVEEVRTMKDNLWNSYKDY